MNPKISACIIAKNESNNIYDCIKSVVNVVDEIIVLDTGSIDDTIKIASGFDKVKVYETIWKNDNSKARNLCISYAVNDWILVLDADERLEYDSGIKLKAFLRFNNFNDENVLSFNYINLNPYSLKHTFFKSSMFKNNVGFSYVKPIHDFPYKENFKNLLCDEFKIIHSNGTTKEFLENKSKLYINRINRLIKETKNKDDLSYYYKHLGDSFIDLNDKKQALESFVKAFDYCTELTNIKYIDSLALRIIPLLNKTQLYSFLKRLIKIRKDQYYIDLLQDLEIKI